MAQGWILAGPGAPNPKKETAMAAKTKRKRNAKGRFTKGGGRSKNPRRKSRKNPRKGRKNAKRRASRKNPRRAKRRNPRSYARKNARRRRRNPNGGGEIIAGLDAMGVAAFAGAMVGTRYVVQTAFGPQYRSGALGAVIGAGTAYGLAWLLKKFKVVSDKTAKGIEMAGLAQGLMGVTETAVGMLPKFGPFIGEKQYRIGVGEKQYGIRRGVGGVGIITAQRPAHLGQGQVGRKALGRSLPQHLKSRG